MLERWTDLISPRRRSHARHDCSYRFCGYLMESRFGRSNTSSTHGTLLKQRSLRSLQHSGLVRNRRSACRGHGSRPTTAWYALSAHIGIPFAQTRAVRSWLQGRLVWTKRCNDTRWMPMFPESLYQLPVVHTACCLNYAVSAFQFTSLRQFCDGSVGCDVSAASTTPLLAPDIHT